ncbi:hypothetical protein FOA43_000114 [Brettanomyces nanus]|uniref:Uncharacterized protein n=1 Tax=Eeniella nana TaxID=13502 RepID=A0A875RY35_EENNA|nr:uncharacterized protein FOA43_000114 [Brettanomyces nanus]QPG72812.1 hypothetical protein FOA43_000114 [Brettanomyces nanus]
MSEEPSQESAEHSDTDQPEYVSVQEVEEVIDENDTGTPEAEDEPMDSTMNGGDNSEGTSGNGVTEKEQGNIEIDLSNNSVAYFDQHEDSIFTVATHPTLPLAATGGGDNATYLWTTHTSPTRFVGKLEGYTESVIASGFTSDGKYLITGDMTGKVLVHKAKKKGQIWTLFAELQQVEEVSWISVHPKQDIFAFGATDGSVWVYQMDESNSPTADLVFTGYSHSMDCTAGAFFDVDNTMGELKLLTVSEDGSIIGWNCYTQQQLFKLNSNQMKGLTPPWVTLDIYENSDHKIAAIGSRNSQVVIINLDAGTIVNVFTALELGPDANIYDASIEGISWCRCANLNLLAVGLVSGDVIIFDTHTWGVRKNMKCQDAVTKVVFFKDSAYLLGSSMDGKVYKWDARTGEVVHTYVGHHMGVLGFGIDCGNRLITAGDEGVSLVYDI